MKRLLLTLLSVVFLTLGLYAQPSPTASSDFDGAHLVQVAHRRHAHRAGHHHYAHGRARRAHRKRA